MQRARRVRGIDFRLSGLVDQADERIVDGVRFSNVLPLAQLTYCPSMKLRMSFMMTFQMM
jgi:hypothetical protein